MYAKSASFLIKIKDGQINARNGAGRIKAAMSKTLEQYQRVFEFLSTVKNALARAFLNSGDKKACNNKQKNRY